MGNVCRPDYVYDNKGDKSISVAGSVQTTHYKFKLYVKVFIDFSNSEYCDKIHSI